MAAIFSHLSNPFMIVWRQMVSWNMHTSGGVLSNPFEIIRIEVTGCAGDTNGRVILSV